MSKVKDLSILYEKNKIRNPFKLIWNRIEKLSSEETCF